jgi:4-amino-4-deoxychorismate lyase
MSDTIGATDRGLHYGDGLFETMRVADGAIPLRERHLKRLIAGAARLDIAVPRAHLDTQLNAAASAMGKGILKVLLTRGEGGRGYSAPPDPVPTLLVQRHPLRLPTLELYQHGLKIGVCDIHLAAQPFLAGIKHLNRLEQVMARRQVDKAGWDEGLLLGPSGEPLELTAMNLFARFGDELWTPALDQAGVAGVMRAQVIEELAPARGLTLRVREGTLSHLQHADELFACNSVAGILPVRKLAQWRWPVGKVTRALQDDVHLLFSGC